MASWTPATVAIFYVEASSVLRGLTPSRLFLLRSFHNCRRKAAPPSAGKWDPLEQCSCRLDATLVKQRERSSASPPGPCTKRQI